MTPRIPLNEPHLLLERFDAEIAALDGTRGKLRPVWAVERLRRAIEREAQAIPLIDVERLAVALDNVDRDYERGWTPAHYARAIAAEYVRLASESSAPPCADAAGHYATLCDCFSAALAVKEGEPE